MDEFTHRYQTPKAWVTRTVFVKGDELWIREGDISWCHKWGQSEEGARRLLAEYARREIEFAHNWAITLNYLHDARGVA